jgi:hypothetical protein
LSARANAYSRREDSANRQFEFGISIGTVIPAGVRYHALPPRIVETDPEWRGCEVILVKGRYVIVRPQAHEFVSIIEGERPSRRQSWGRAAMPAPACVSGRR